MGVHMDVERPGVQESADEDRYPEPRLGWIPASNSEGGESRRESTRGGGGQYPPRKAQRFTFVLYRDSHQSPGDYRSRAMTASLAGRKDFAMRCNLNPHNSSLPS